MTLTLAELEQTFESSWKDYHSLLSKWETGWTDTGLGMSSKSNCSTFAPIRHQTLSKDGKSVDMIPSIAGDTSSAHSRAGLEMFMERVSSLTLEDALKVLQYECDSKVSPRFTLTTRRYLQSNISAMAL